MAGGPVQRHAPRRAMQLLQECGDLELRGGGRRRRDRREVLHQLRHAELSEPTSALLSWRYRTSAARRASFQLRMGGGARAVDVRRRTSLRKARWRCAQRVGE
jgi:hypothetical protein